MPQLLVQITEEQAAWLDSQCDRYNPKARLIRDLIDTARQGIDSSVNLPAYRVGAGIKGIQERVPAVQAVKPDQPEFDVLAVQETSVPSAVPAQDLESKNQINMVVNAKKSRAKRTKGSPEFEQFWRLYQGSPLKANGQSKPKAWQVYQQLIPEELSSEDLDRAVTAAVEDIQTRQRAGEFAAPLPDCFRWLRDECYAVFLESHTPAQACKPAHLIY